MRIQIQLRIVADDNSVISEGEIVHFDKGDEQSVQLPGSSALLTVALSGCCRSLLKLDQFRAVAPRRWRHGSAQSHLRSQAGRHPARDRAVWPAPSDAVPGDRAVRMAGRTG